MGCASSTTIFTETMAVSGVVDLALVRGFTDADAAEFARTVERVGPITLRVPRFPCPDAKLAGAGLSQLFVAGAGSLTTVELNEAALPRVPAEAAAQALGCLGDVQEVSIRGESWPRRVLALLAKHETMPLSSVRSVLLGGAGVDSATLLALPKAFPCCQKLYLQNPDGITDWLSTAISLRSNGVLLMHVTHLVIDAPVELDPVAVKAVEAVCPLIRSAVAHPQGPSRSLWLPSAQPPGLYQTSARSGAADATPFASCRRQHVMSPRSLDSVLTSARPVNPLIGLSASLHHRPSSKSPLRSQHMDASVVSRSTGRSTPSLHGDRRFSRGPNASLGSSVAMMSVSGATATTTDSADTRAGAFDGVMSPPPPQQEPAPLPQFQLPRGGRSARTVAHMAHSMGLSTASRPDSRKVARVTASHVFSKHGVAR